MSIPENEEIFTSANIAETVPKGNAPESSDYSLLLSRQDIQFTSSEVYLHVAGHHPKSNWIFHLSVVRFQFLRIAETIIGYCIKEQFAFRIPRNASYHTWLLDASFGYEKLGKIITIYPGQRSDVTRVAMDLVKLANKCIGPAIPTDYKIGGCVFTRWVPIEKEFGKALPNYCIPFILPVGVTWPFGRIVAYKPKVERKMLNRKYIPYCILKSDAKGKVYKAIHVKNIVNFVWCLIKEGKANMWMDDWGRDIRTRLQWQAWVLQQLKGVVPVPDFIDLINIDGDGYLITEFIEGQSIEALFIELFEGRVWIHQKPEKKREILHWLIKTFEAIEILHQNGYVHRDVTPANFMATPKGALYLVDLELCFQSGKKIPKPPFRLGTPGYISLEQRSHSFPTLKEDIYAMGCFMLATFFRISPSRLEISDPSTFKDNLRHFVRHEPLEQLIFDCLMDDPMQRPTTGQVIEGLKEYGTVDIMSQKQISVNRLIAEEKIKQIVQESINGLGHSDVIADNGVWFKHATTKVDGNHTANFGKVLQPGLYDGVAGILYTLCSLSQQGYDISTLDAIMDNAMSFLTQWESAESGILDSSFAMGAAGNLYCYVQLELWKPGKFKELLQEALKKIFAVDKKDLSLSFGLSGKLLAMSAYMEKYHASGLESFVNDIEEVILDRQIRDGSWNIIGKKKGSEQSLFLYEGICGIVLVLLKRFEWTKKERLIRPIEKGLSYLRKAYLARTPKIYTEVSEILLKGQAGLAVCFLKAYEIIGENEYADLFENILKYYPSEIHSIDLSMASGLSGIGQLYLEGYRCTGKEEMKSKSFDIAEHIVRYSRCSSQGMRYWISGNAPIPTAGYMNGNAGIIHFLARCVETKDLQFLPICI